MEVAAESVDAKICHCQTCQKLHGAPMQWALIFHKEDVRVSWGRGHLSYFNCVSKRNEHRPPCKVSCAICGTLLADESRQIWIAFPSTFGFSAVEVPSVFLPYCQTFYAERIMDVSDALPKWAGHKGRSTQIV